MNFKIACFLGILPIAALAEAPLSAIDWLEQNKNQTNVGQITQEPTISTGVSIPQIEVAPLDSVQHSAVGLLPSSITGFPASIWRNSQTDDLIALMRKLDIPTIPAIQNLYLELLLAEADAPFSRHDNNYFLKNRIDILIKLGAIDPAIALMERASPLPPHMVPQLFDLSLLGDHLEPACSAVLALGANYPDDAARIYCLAREGDWLMAQLVLNTASALGSIDPKMQSLLHQFLETNDEDEFDVALPPSLTPSPLEFRLSQAIGTPLFPESLPRAYSVSDLSGDNGWKAQLHAVEKLAETGTLNENRFLGIYTQHQPSASGGIWDRVAQLQNLDQKISTGIQTDIEHAFKTAWQTFQKTRLATTFAKIFAPSLINRTLDKNTTTQVFNMALLTNDYETAAQKMHKSNLGNPILWSIALGDMSLSKPTTDLEIAIYEGFTNPRVPSYVHLLLSEGKLGEAILNALVQLEHGINGDLQDLLEAISILELVGLNHTSRRAALYVLIQNHTP